MKHGLLCLDVTNIRNLKTKELCLGPGFNLFCGQNGSGKTSILEAVNILGVGKSFRTHAIQQLITFGEQCCLVRGMLGSGPSGKDSTIWLAVEKRLNGQNTYRLGEKNERSISELTKSLPVQAIDIHSHLVVEGGPLYRRRFVDWGLFHVEQDFLLNWRGLQRALVQRNASLKQRKTPDSVWDEAFIKYAMLVDAARRSYVERLAVVLVPQLQQMLGLNRVSLQYTSGWDVKRGLAAHLLDNAAIDGISGHTSCGPHRGDVVILVDDRPVKEVLSRGQIKVFVCAMLLARTEMLSNPERALFLIDDLHAELDHSNCKTLVSAIARLGCQAFVTGIEESSLCRSTEGFTTNVFHVEQGEIFERV